MKQNKKVAVVTGAFRGSGSQITNLLTKNNYKVYALDLNFKKTITEKYNLVSYKIDLSKFSEIKKFVKFLKKKETKVDCLVNNAGISLKKNISNIEYYWKKTISVNLDAIFFISELLVPLLKKSKFPSIVNISSISAKIAMSNNPAYNSSKAGVLALTSSQAFDYSKYKIRSNTICPGYVKTNMTKKSFQNKNAKNKRENRLITKRFGTPNDISELVFFLCSQNSEYINGEDIVIDGGFLKKGI
tara:strand:- start:467 stop:1198 length:732 start_codon:yes stop_codon:yes gene_type:complete